MDSKKIAIIVPIYNSEKYLSRCINSILIQTYKNLEIILVDDGSTDTSKKLCDNFAQKDNRIKVFHTKNGGVSSARNIGIKYIKNTNAEFIIQLDSDDWIEPIMLEKMYKKAVSMNSDMVICDFISETNENKVYEKQNFKKNDCNSLIEDIILGKIHGALWNKLIKAELYKKYNCLFSENISYCED